MKPIIGLTPSPSDDTFDHGTFHRYAISSTYTEAIERAGGVPVILPPQQDGVEELLSVIDGLLLTGGGDIRPELYGDREHHPKTYGVHDLRDSLEISLLRGALERDMPVLCICRGIQVLNVALGGTLIQDIADQHGTDLEHRQQKNCVESSEPSHEVQVKPGSLLHRIYGTESIQVNSFHHQALKKVSDSLTIIATASDGIVEAVEYPNSSWVLGLQWHPEMMFSAHEEHLKPFTGLVQAAQVNRSTAARNRYATTG